MSGLEVEPELGGRVQGLGKKPRGLRRYPTLASDQFVDALNRYPEMLGESHLGLVHGVEEFFKKNLTRMSGNTTFRLHV